MTDLLARFESRSVWRLTALLARVEPGGVRR